MLRRGDVRLMGDSVATPLFRVSVFVGLRCGRVWCWRTNLYPALCQLALHLGDQGHEAQRECVPLLRFLFAYIENPDFTWRFRWQANSVAMWDNRNTQHRALADNLRDTRHMERGAILASPA
jgi:hypothetical protein